MFSHFVHRELWCSASVLVDDYYSITFSFFFSQLDRLFLPQSAGLVREVPSMFPEDMTQQKTPTTPRVIYRTKIRLTAVWHKKYCNNLPLTPHAYINTLTQIPAHIRARTHSAGPHRRQKTNFDGGMHECTHFSTHPHTCSHTNTSSANILELSYHFILSCLSFPQRD